MKLTKLILGVILLATMGILTACNPLSEVQEKQYNDYTSLVEAGEIERGWAPKFLPASATNIHIKYNLENNAILLAFDFDPADAAAMTQACHPVNLAPTPTLTADWWPQEITSESFAHVYECAGGYLALQEGRGYYWAGTKAPKDAIPITSLYQHPDKYLDLDGKRVTVVGYVDFSNIHDLREMYYSQEGIGFVRKPGQTADAIFFVYFDPEDDPHPLFDKLHALQPTHEETGLLLMATGVLHAYDQPTNFSTRTGYVMNVESPDDVMILK
jgi:hypothetical protein